MTERVVINIPDSSSESSNDSLPEPSPFSPEYRRPRPLSEQEITVPTSPATKRQRLSVLEQVEEGEDDEFLSDPSDVVMNGETETEPKQDDGHGTRSSEQNGTDREGNAASEQHESVGETSGTSVEVMQEETKTENVSDRKLPAKQSEPSPVQQQYNESPDTDDSSDASNDDLNDEVVSHHVKLQPIPSNLRPLEPVTQAEVEVLKKALQFDPNDPDDVWPTEWSGRIDLFTREVTNPLRDEKSKGDDRTVIAWAETSPKNLSLARALMRYVYNEPDTPPTAKRILAITHNESIRVPGYDMEPAMRRLSFDPAVLREDGWTTKKSQEPVGATGGPHHIGERVVWQRWEGVVIAYLHDEDIGDLWKAMWLEGNETFDLEAEELQEARKKWDRKNKQSEQAFSALPSARFASIAKFTVEGIETGIIMAKSYDARARHGLFWPARVMHSSEVAQLPSQSRRSSSKQRLHVFFLAPYWNSVPEHVSRPPLGDSLSLGSSAFSSAPLIERDVVEISEDTIQPYPYQGENGLNIDELQVAFKFTGLPKSAFSRFLDSHRLALALKTYAEQELLSSSTHSHEATAALTDTPALANEAAKFPVALLHLPFEYILSKLPRDGEQNSLSTGQSDDSVEPAIQLRSVMASMEPPACWGQESKSSKNGPSPINGQRITPALSAALASSTVKRQLVTSVSNGSSDVGPSVTDIQDVASEYLIHALTQTSSSAPGAAKLLDQLRDLLARARKELPELKSLSNSQRRKKLILFLKACLRVKGHGEDVISSEVFDVAVSSPFVLTEWRKACEYIYKYASALFSFSNFGNSTTFVITDSRCNEHITSSGCVERPVRLPAALKGARLAGRKTGRNVELILSVGDDYMTLAEVKVIGMAHSSTYLKRMRAKCAAIAPGVSGAALTDDSNFEGGEDTKGSRGSYTAAVAGVAAAIKGVDMIVGGQCVNAFCATRPPGHHAGRELHPMKAVSNGFCILNSAACAALYATTPVSEHGPGLRRVCVIDIDVHHGNGTQNILCETYDPRFLYISLHAGGAHINGHEDDDGEMHEYRASIGSQDKQDAIFPGRCGDTSPHKGVMNIPLGAQVNPQDMGMALASLVGPAVAKFSPDLIIVSAGFDAHKHDPLGMGGLTAEDFGHATDVICSMAKKCCSGRVLSILEGGYGVPCCRPQRNLFLPNSFTPDRDSQSAYEGSDDESGVRAMKPQLQPPQVQIMDLGSDLPNNMDDQVPQTMHKTLSRCHAEGFVECVREHVGSLAENNDRSKL